MSPDSKKICSKIVNLRKKKSVFKNCFLAQLRFKPRSVWFLVHVLKQQTIHLLESYSQTIFPFAYNVWAKIFSQLPLIILPTLTQIHHYSSCLSLPHEIIQCLIMLLRAQTFSTGEEASSGFSLLSLLWTHPPLSSASVCLVPGIPSLTQSPSCPTCIPPFSWLPLASLCWHLPDKISVLSFRFCIFSYFISSGCLTSSTGLWGPQRWAPRHHISLNACTAGHITYIS